MRHDDFPRVYEIVKETGALDVHRPYTYWVMLSASPSLAMVSEAEGVVNGFVTGLAPYRDADLALLWQVGVTPTDQGKGTGLALLEEFGRVARSLGFRRLAFTIEPSNEKSLRLFASYARLLAQELTSSGETGSLGGALTPESVFELILK